MQEKIEGLVNQEVAVDFLHNSRNFDITLITEFENRKPLNTYQTHPEHILVSLHMSDVRVLPLPVIKRSRNEKQ